LSKDQRKRWMASIEPTTKPGAKPGVKAGTKPAVQSSPRGSSERPASTPAARFVASGLGLTSERSRASMVERLVKSGITDRRVLEVMGRIPRHEFVDQGFASRAYEDSALPIGHHQTISQPYIVARMTEIVCNGKKPMRALEIGTGCGYQAAVLAGMASEVFSIERIRALHERARQNLRPLRIANLRLLYGDGLLGIPEVAPFDAMLIAAAAPSLPASLINQLAVGGRAIAPLGDLDQTLCLIERHGRHDFVTTALEAVRFVPLHPGIR
jgi:protein-L-isoaspartate(D-aspartate) O-methyltransferase